MKELFIYTWHDRSNRKYCLTAIACSMLLFLLFKLIYPYPDLGNDSYSYIYAARINADINAYPIGYSKFLNAIHHLTRSSFVLTGFQYILLQISLISFFFSVRLLYKLGKKQSVILFIFLMLNPISLFISNMVSNDSLFSACTCLWLTQLIWIVYRPKVTQVIIQAVLVSICLTLSNHAFYYPFIAVFCFLLSGQSWSRKIIGSLASLLLIVPFVLHSRHEAYKLTGTAQYPLYGGWRIANNALYIFEYADSMTGLSEEELILDKYTRQLYQIAPKDFRESYLTRYAGDFYIQESLSPLQKYASRYYKPDDPYSKELVAWAKVSPLYREFGSKLIRHNLNAYLWEFVLPNIKNYLYPPLERWEIYNKGAEEVNINAKEWFGWNTTEVNAFSYGFSGRFLYIFRPICAIINLYFLINLLVFFLNSRPKQEEVLMKKGIYLTGAFILINFVVSISSYLIVFRCEYFSMLATGACAMALSQYINQFADKIEEKNESADLHVIKNNVLHHRTN